MAEFKTLNVNNGTWDVKDETARNDIDTINDTIDNTITPSLATLNSTKASTTDLTNAIEALDYTDTAVTGQYVSAVSETDGVISVTRDSLPTKLSDFTDDVVAGNYLSLMGGTVNGDIKLASSGQYFFSPTGFIVDFSGNNTTHYGKTFIHSSVYGSDSMIIEWPQLNAGETVSIDFPATTGTVALTSDITTDIAAAIADLDYSDTAVTGQYVSAVSETDGVISVTRDSLPTKLSDFTDDVVAGNYLPLTGGSLTGVVNFNATSNNTFAFAHNDVNGNSVASLNNYNSTQEILRIGGSTAEGILRMQNGSYSGSFRNSGLTGNRNYYLPDAGGTLALTSDIPTISTTEVSATSNTVQPNITTAVCTMSIPKGYNIIRVGISVPNDVTATDFMASFLSTAGATGTMYNSAHRYVGNPIGSSVTFLEFVYTQYFSSATTLYCNLTHNNANAITLQSCARIISIS